MINKYKGGCVKKFIINIEIQSEDLITAIDKTKKKLEELVNSHHCGISILDDDFLLNTKNFCIKSFQEREILSNSEKNSY